jgi:hypothetical protein
VEVIIQKMRNLKSIALSLVATLALTINSCNNSELLEGTIINEIPLNSEPLPGIHSMYVCTIAVEDTTFNYAYVQEPAGKSPNQINEEYNIGDKVKVKRDKFGTQKYTPKF